LEFAEDRAGVGGPVAIGRTPILRAELLVEVRVVVVDILHTVVVVDQSWRVLRPVFCAQKCANGVRANELYAFPSKPPHSLASTDVSRFQMRG